MSRLEDLDLDQLRAWLDRVDEKETTERLMAAIAHKEGQSVDELADWYDWDPATIDAWFDEFESRPLADLVDELERLNYGSSAPFVPNRHPRATVEYLNYEVLDDYGWSLEDDDLFEKAHREDLPSEDLGRVVVNPSETIIEAVENRGFEWPYACRGGACSNCAVVLVEGEIAMPGDTVLTEEAIEEDNVRLTCVGVPATEEVKVVYNAKQMDALEDLLLPPGPFEAGAGH